MCKNDVCKIWIGILWRLLFTYRDVYSKDLGRMVYFYNVRLCY